MLFIETSTYQTTIFMDIEFIKRANAMFAEPAKEKHKERQKDQLKLNEKWRKENPEKFKSSVKKYSQSEKGKLAARKRSCLRNSRVKKAIQDLTDQDKEKIKDIYINCPPGYHVDHIIPISKGGKHHPVNLQYLPITDNLRKSDTLPSFFKFESKNLRLQYLSRITQDGLSWSPERKKISLKKYQKWMKQKPRTEYIHKPIEWNEIYGECFKETQ